MTDMRKKFDELKKKKQVSDEQASKPKTDERLIKFVPGNTYRFRLLFSTSDKRSSPFIEKVTHNFYSKEKRSSGWITCPTSEYIDGKYGYKNCQACGKVSDFWKQKDNGSISAGELYNTFKRKNVCFAPVYVVSDGSNPENNGKVKIMKYGYTVYEFLEREVFARDPKTKKPIVDAETTGPDAFELTNGYDLIVTVTQKTKEFPAYSCSWSKKPLCHLIT